MPQSGGQNLPLAAFACGTPSYPFVLSLSKY